MRAAKLGSMRGTTQVQESGIQDLNSQQPLDRWWTGALLLTIVLSLVVRIIGLGSKSVFADELSSFQFAHMSWRAFWELISRSEANMSLYYVLLRLWVHLSSGVAWVRFLSVMFAVATVPLIYALGKELFSRTAGLFACLLFALNTFHISYSQAGRGYSLAVFLAALSCWFFNKTVREPSTGNLIGYALASAVALYGHFFTGFVLLAQCVALVLWRPARAELIRQAFLMLAVGVLGIPLFLFAAVHKTGPISWVEPVTGKDVYHFFTYLSGSGLKFGLSMVAVALAATDYWRKRHREEYDRMEWSFLLLAMWLLVPIVTTLLISIWKPVFSPRFLMIVLPAFVLLVGKGVAGIRPAWAEYMVAGALLLSNATALSGYYRQPGIEDWRSTVAYLQREVQPADSIVINNPSFREILNYSFREFRTEPPTRNIIPGPASEDLLRRSDHTWVVWCHPDASEEAGMSALKAKFGAREAVQFVGIVIVEFDRGRP